MRLTRISRLPGRRLLHASTLAAVTLLVAWAIVTRVTQVNPVDFLVYRYGAQALVNGADLYSGNLFGPMMPVGGMPFTYTPFAAVALIPTTLFDARTAYLLWSALSVAVVAWAVDRFTPPGIRRRTPVVAALTLLVSSTSVITQHVSFGQINLALMALVLVDTLRSDSGRLTRIVPRGLLVGIAAAIKLTPALVIVYFVVTRQWRAALWSAIGGVAATIAGFLVAPSISVEFWSQVIWSLDERVDFGGGGFVSYGNNSLQGILAAAAPALHSIALPVVVIAAVGAMVLARQAFRQGRGTDALLIVGLTAPLLSPISWIHHWVYLIPAAVTLIFRGTTRVRVTALLMLVFLIPGPGLGEWMIGLSPLLAPLGWVFRESLALSSILCIVLVALPPRRTHPIPPPVARKPATLTGSRLA